MSLTWGFESPLAHYCLLPAAFAAPGVCARSGGVRGLSVAEILGKLRFPYRFLDFGNASELALPKSASRWGRGLGGGASPRGRSREAVGGVPPRVLRDYCRKTLTPQPLAELPPSSGRAQNPGSGRVCGYKLGFAG